MAGERRPNIIIDQRCSFCTSPVPRGEAVTTGADAARVRCPCCGIYRISGSAIDEISNWSLAPGRWAAIAYRLKRMTNRSEPPWLDSSTLRALRDTARLPHADEIL